MLSWQNKLHNAFCGKSCAEPGYFHKKPKMGSAEHEVMASVLPPAFSQPTRTASRFTSG